MQRLQAAECTSGPLGPFRGYPGCHHPLRRTLGGRLASTLCLGTAATRGRLGRVIQRHTIHVHTQHTSPSFTLPSGTLASIDLAAKLLVVSKKKNPYTHLTTLMKTKRVKGAHAIPLHHCELRHEFHPNFDCIIPLLNTVQGPQRAGAVLRPDTRAVHASYLPHHLPPRSHVLRGPEGHSAM
jgi:hypothetical protein